MQVLSPITVTTDNVLLRVKVQPAASKNSIKGVRGDELVVAVQAPATKDKANKELVKYLSKVTGSQKSSIIIQRGKTSRHKTVRFPLEAAENLKKLVISQTDSRDTGIQTRVGESSD